MALPLLLKDLYDLNWTERSSKGMNMLPHAFKRRVRNMKKTWLGSAESRLPTWFITQQSYPNHRLLPVWLTYPLSTSLQDNDINFHIKRELISMLLSLRFNAPNTATRLTWGEENLSRTNSIWSRQNALRKIRADSSSRCRNISRWFYFPNYDNDAKNISCSWRANL